MYNIFNVLMYKCTEIQKTQVHSTFTQDECQIASTR